MNSPRRNFIRSSLFALGATPLAGCKGIYSRDLSPQVMTVAGPVPSQNIGLTLPHEHALVDFIGAAEVTRDRYDSEEVFRKVLPHLEHAFDLGCRTFIDCTPAYIGRDAALLKRLAIASGLNILTNTGFYGAVQNKFLPSFALAETADQLAARWIAEAKNGIENTGIRPGFIKIGVDAGALSETHAKLVRAAAQTHKETGLVIAAHTGDGTAALDEIEIIRKEGLSGSAFVWVHAQNERNSDVHAQAATLGAWVEFDGISPSSIDRHVAMVRSMRGRGHWDRVLVSHDAGWYHVGEPGGGSFRSFDTLFTQFLPALRETGFSETEIRQLVIDNPRRAFSIGVRRR